MDTDDSIAALMAVKFIKKSVSRKLRQGLEIYRKRDNQKRVETEREKGRLGYIYKQKQTRLIETEREKSEREGEVGIHIQTETEKV